ncbi:MAG TPA: 50S ribosomal protein L11 methyltransferase [Thermodesulfobacteriota bacterium]
MGFEPYVEFRTSASKIPLKTQIGDEIIIQIVPGSSFGAGHQTTRLCVAAIEEIFKTEDIGNVLDFGCGSGILGISAAVLGAKSVLAIDIDPIAVEESIRNAEINHVSSVVKVLYGSLEDARGKFDLVLANIVTDELLRTVEGIKRLLDERGMVVVSGISEIKRELAIRGFIEAGFSLKKEFTAGGWAAIWFNLRNST